ncbi:MAG TPA: quinone-dependent dihydroorotate dehydrogenase [Myxococcota bacterium]|nr:quinone-dependent dihydroorotate dehydrogenase [Myxococcota bacterium]HQK49844.1 quinone-dependent dihydroorotate dehydrogenase [Myxococcota bacterium]
MYERLLRPLLFLMGPEQAHDLVLAGLSLVSRVPGVPGMLRRVLCPRRPVRLLGCSFAHPLGLAAGFDKDGVALPALYGLGFSFVEVGSVTAGPWPGNPHPRIWRLPRHHAVINRMGLPSQGADRVAARLRRGRPPYPVFINVAKTGDPGLHGDRAVEDIRRAVDVLRGVADVLVLNLSCPNTEDGRTFEDPAALAELLRALALRPGDGPPVLAKVSPDQPEAAREALVQEALRGGVTGFVATNTTKSRDALGDPPSGGWPQGGLSGEPLRQRSLAVVRHLRQVLGPRVPVVGCGGISGPDHAEAFLDAGADLLEAYTGFLYRGPCFVRKVIQSLPPSR